MRRVRVRGGASEPWGGAGSLGLRRVGHVLRYGSAHGGAHLLQIAGAVEVQATLSGDSNRSAGTLRPTTLPATCLRVSTIGCQSVSPTSAVAVHAYVCASKLHESVITREACESTAKDGLSFCKIY